MQIKLLLFFNLMFIFGYLLFPNASFSAYYEKANYNQESKTRTNKLGGYNYRNSNGSLIGYSKKTSNGNYIYYNKFGRKIGRLKKNKKGSYTVYNDYNVKIGFLSKTPSGRFRLKNKNEGSLTSFIPPPGENIGFISPDNFGLLSNEKENTSDKKE